MTLIVHWHVGRLRAIYMQYQNAKFLVIMEGTRIVVGEGLLTTICPFFGRMVIEIVFAQWIELFSYVNRVIVREKHTGQELVNTVKCPGILGMITLAYKDIGAYVYQIL